MSRVEEIEHQVSSLSEQELARYRVWFAECDERQGDKQLEADAENGKLDRMAESAKRAYDAGLTRTR
ncbi:MAG: hypothetical protein HYV26_10985 [Candidatus Hydrogenedentes bacterium]|nr:hypothetical protein [Candidatus Hydrogenedentota bacterium]